MSVVEYPLTLNLPGINEAREFTVASEYGVPVALGACLSKVYRPLFMPEIVRARIDATGSDDRAWSCWWTTQSAKATGRGIPSNGSQKSGTALVVYAHVPNYFSEPKNIRTAIRKGLQFGHGEMPQEEFQRLLGMEDGENAIVVDSATMRRWPSGYYGIGEPTKEHMDNFGGKINGKDMIAINHPSTKPFLGPGNAQRYLEAHKKLLAGGHVINIMESDNFLDI